MSLPDPAAVRFVILLGPPDHDMEYPSKVLFSVAHNTYLCITLYDILWSHPRLKDGRARYGIFNSVLYLE